MSVIKMTKSQQVETDIAVLQVQVNNIEEKISEIKTDVKEVRDSLEKHSKEHTDMIKAMEQSAQTAHIELSKKISALEKWRWMLMGAGVVIGSLGYDTVAKLLK
jgi:cell division septum initiation protein DivIVA